MTKNFIAISGSLREHSYNTYLLKALQKLVPEGSGIEIVSIGDFPLFNQDLEQDYPVQVAEVKAKIKASDGVIFATPEYNRSVPGVLKNAIDWLSRPYGTNVFDDKKALVLGASHSAIGTALAQAHLKQSLLFLNMRIFGQPEFYLSFAKDKFNQEGELIDQDTKDHLIKIWDKFASLD